MLAGEPISWPPAVIPDSQRALTVLKKKVKTFYLVLSGAGLEMFLTTPEVRKL
jgi:hypothetical protein